jgi:hypothetical protein
LKEKQTWTIVLYCNNLLTKHVTHNINIMHNILKGQKVRIKSLLECPNFGNGLLKIKTRVYLRQCFSTQTLWLKKKKNNHGTPMLKNKSRQNPIGEEKHLKRIYITFP